MMNFDLEPVSFSRNWDEEVFDEPLPLNPPDFKWKETVALPLKCSKLLVGTRGAGATFLECFIPPTRILGTLTVSHTNPDTRPSKNAPTCTIYALDNETLVAACQYDVEPDLSFIWVKTLFSAIIPQQVFVFDALLSSFYRAPNRPSPPLLRKLQTSSFKHSYDVPFLESPNMVEKISAAVLSYCEVRQIPAVAFVSLQDTLFVTSTTIGAFEKILRAAPFSISPPSDLSKTYVRATEHLNVSSDNGLYI
eukprot:Phypoly_transcript_15584.p1 GENE.Phypoly_transcript_15584~~Phypoly_transcript_15584.p1  ORF type:complete len:250 (+),score=21.16 Phypoly_transcript_15584:144-893(+)